MKNTLSIMGIKIEGTTVTIEEVSIQLEATPEEMAQYTEVMVKNMQPLISQVLASGDIGR